MTLQDAGASENGAVLSINALQINSLQYNHPASDIFCCNLPGRAGTSSVPDCELLLSAEAELAERASSLHLQGSTCRRSCTPIAISDRKQSRRRPEVLVSTQLLLSSS